MQKCRHMWDFHGVHSSEGGHCNYWMPRVDPGCHKHKLGHGFQLGYFIVLWNRIEKKPATTKKRPNLGIQRRQSSSATTTTCSTSSTVGSLAWPLKVHVNATKYSKNAIRVNIASLLSDHWVDGFLLLLVVVHTATALAISLWPRDFLHPSAAAATHPWFSLAPLSRNCLREIVSFPHPKESKASAPWALHWRMASSRR